MNHHTKNALSRMRGLAIRFLDISGTIEENEWNEVIKAVQRNKAKLDRTQSIVGLGDLFILMVYVQEILEAVIADIEPPENV